MKCDKFEHCYAFSDEPEDCWFCIHFKYWGKTECMIPEKERWRQRVLAATNKHQAKLVVKT